MIKNSITFIAKYGVTSSIVFLLGLAGAGVSYGAICIYNLFKRSKS